MVSRCWLIFLFSLCCSELNCIQVHKHWQRKINLAKKFNKMDADKLVNVFNHKMFNEILKNSNGNVVFSPYSISAAMAMVYEGSRGNTKNEIAQTFGWDEANTNTFREKFRALVDRFIGSSVAVANKVWLDKENDVDETYKNSLATFYRAVIGTEDFQKNPEVGRQNINNWVAQQTENKIKDLFPDGSIDSMTKLVLANAIFFKENWKTPFDKQHTRKSEFKLENGENAEVDMMWKNDKFFYLSDKKYDVVKLPYHEDKYSMVVAVPRKISANELAEHVTSSLLDSWLQKLKNSRFRMEIDVFLPRFKIQHAINLKSHLQNMGTAKLFTSGKADLSGINGQLDLYCSGAYHKAFIEVDEEGTVAGAATGFGMVLMSMPPQIRADRPFLFYIIDEETNVILFSGKVADPTKL